MVNTLQIQSRGEIHFAASAVIQCRKWGWFDMRHLRQCLLVFGMFAVAIPNLLADFCGP
jgi:hypothetical protein